MPDNKLHTIQSVVGLGNDYHSAHRREEIVSARARIGHTYLTHAYLLKSENSPQCIPCDCDLTVKHILLECIEYMHVRQRYFSAPDLRTLYHDVKVSKILAFLKEVDLFMRF